MTLRGVPAVNMLRSIANKGVHLKCGSDFRFRTKRTHWKRSQREVPSCGYSLDPGCR
jgi:hypothetical protein